jgi:hypothetical protein
MIKKDTKNLRFLRIHLYGKAHEFIAFFDIPENPCFKFQHNCPVFITFMEVSNIHFFVTKHENATFVEKKSS